MVLTATRELCSCIHESGKAGGLTVNRQPLNDKYILCPFQIQMCDLQGGIALATGFFYQIQDETFIITNWHNVTGKHQITGKPLELVRSPLFLRAKWPVINNSPNLEDGQKSAYMAAQKIEIEDDDGPLWFEHPTLGSMCDVVAIPINRSTDWPPVLNAPANKIDETPIPMEPGLKIVVIGFPQGVSTGPGLPLIKAGVLSSLPGYEVRLGGEFSDIGGMKGGTSLPAMLLDVHSIPGMSGSPVFGEYTGFWNPDEVNRGEIADSSVLGTSRIFLGCHSSRLLEHEERAGLGICYQASAIEEICRAKQRGSRFPRNADEKPWLRGGL